MFWKMLESRAVDELARTGPYVGENENPMFYVIVPTSQRGNEMRI